MDKIIAQGLFDRVVMGLKSQGYKKSIDAEGYCSLRGNDGRKCAVGHLLTDEDYAITRESLWYAMDKVTPGLEYKPLIRDMADAHDNGREPYDMIANLAEVADRYNLNHRAFDE